MNEYLDRLKRAIKAVLTVRPVDVISHLDRLKAECRERGIQTEGKAYGQVVKELNARRRA